MKPIIESSQNPRIKRIIRLRKSAKIRNQYDCFIVEGWKTVREAIDIGLAEKIYVSMSETDLLGDKLPEAADIEIVSDQIFSLISDTTTPQGVLAIVRKPKFDLNEITKRKNSSLLCLEGIRDPGNMGTIIRTAEGAGFDGLILSKETVDIYNPKTVRATMGSIFRVPFFVSEDFHTDLSGLKRDGFQLYAAHLHGERKFYEERDHGKIGILIGNEAAGLSKNISDLADVRIFIPMEGKLESLNAAICAGILMYEVHTCKNKGG
ncbi:MAG: RNA methyltransferase [Lachnoclostridium sp.]|jgi:TrmH family RNA methyltransferase|nr:RNA methyltransferase [Lachnoclostridium sp.]